MTESHSATETATTIERYGTCFWVVEELYEEYFTEKTITRDKRDKELGEVAARRA